MKSITGGLLELVNRAPIPLSQNRPRPFADLTAHARRNRHLSAMEAQATIFAIVDRTSSGVASAIWRLYRKARSGRKEDRTEIFDHPALSVWRKPNPFYTQEEFVETGQQHYELVGEYWWIVARARVRPVNGVPIELWPVRPDRMRPVPDARKFISAFVYGVGSDEIRLRTQDVIYNKRPNPMSAYRGLGPVGSLLLDVEGERAAAEWNANFFRNGAEPGGVLETDEWLNDEEFKQVTNRWEGNHQGVANAHRVAVAEGGLKWVERKFSMRDMQFEQLRRFSKAQFREAWGFPKALLGDVEDVNRANAEAAEVVFSRWLVVPRLKKLRTTLNDDFLPMFGELGRGYEFDFDDPVPPNAQEEREATRMRVQSAVALIKQKFDPAETLEAWDLPPITHTGEPDTSPPDPDPLDDGL